MKRNYLKAALAMLAVVGFIGSGVAVADPRGGGHRGGEGPRGGGEPVMDRHFHHDHAYPPRGVVVDVVPRGAWYGSHYRGGNYYYHGGAWYRPYGPRFVVVAPPIGIMVPFLPPFYTTLWVGGFPYYYANEAYYSWRPESRGYEVVPPPAGVEEAQVQPGSDELFIYPKRGQNEEQQANDRYDCHHWAVTQTGYDPTQPAAAGSADRRGDYRRAMTACLEARDYSVK